MERLDAYVRVSRVAGRSGDSYISPSVQRDEIQRWADYRGVKILEWHVDEDVSGGAMSRPKLDLAINRAVEGLTDGIVTARIDRFSRFTEKGLADLRRLNQAKARLVFVHEDVDVRGPMGQMVYTLMLAQAEYFLANIKAAWEVAKSRAVERGAYISRTPFGYQRNDDGTLSPHPENAPIVTRAFEIAAANSVQAAMTFLKDAVPDRRWTTTTARRLLSGRSYLGETRYGELVQTGTHQPLVSRAVWEAAQTTPSTRKPSADYPLSGVLHCGTCQSTMVGGRGGQGQRTYRCARRCGRPPVVTAERVEAHVRSVLGELLAGLRATVSEPQSQTVSLLERAVLEAEAELDAFAGDLTARRLLGDRYHAALQARAEAVDEARAALRAEAQRMRPDLEVSATDALDDPAMLGRLLGSIFDRVEVLPGRGLSIGERVRFVPFDGDESSGMAGAE